MQDSDMIQPSAETKISKNDITAKVLKNQTFINLIELYKTDDKSIFSINLESEKEWNNGLLQKIILITDKKTNLVNTIIVPLFSTEKTITWSLSFYPVIQKSLEAAGYQAMSSQIKCCLFFMDKETNDLSFMSVIKLDDWIEHGNKGKNGKSVFFWNDKLPNQWSLNSSKLKTEIKRDFILTLNKKDLKTWCLNEGKKLAKTFANSNRSEKTIAQHSADGIYAEIWLYKLLKEQGHNVEFNWRDGDDLGIDIIYTTNGQSYGIDVKTTKDSILKIKRLRERTHFYAVIDSKDKNNLQLIGFCHKWQFWPSKYGTNIKPDWNEKTEMYEKKLTKKWVKETFVTINQLKDIESEINKTKLKRKEQLFEL